MKTHEMHDESKNKSLLYERKDKVIHYLNLRFAAQAKTYRVDRD